MLICPGSFCSAKLPKSLTIELMVLGRFIFLTQKFGLVFIYLGAWVIFYKHKMLQPRVHPILWLLQTIVKVLYGVALESVGTVGVRKENQGKR